MYRQLYSLFKYFFPRKNLRQKPAAKTCGEICGETCGEICGKNLR